MYAHSAACRPPSFPLNEGHGYREKEKRDIYQQAVVMFFREHLESEAQ